MTPEDQIRMLVEENARLKAQAGNVYQGYAGPAGEEVNAYGQTPDDLRRAEAEARWQAEQAYMGNGMSDLMYRNPRRKAHKPPRENPSPYLRKENGR